MQDLMLDIETLDIRPSAVVLSIGAVMFDRYSDAQGATFYVELTGDLQKQINLGRTISADTLTWWMCQSPEARNVFDHPDENTPRYGPQAATELFSQFCGQHRPQNIWAKDPDFDVVILRSLYESVGRGYNFPFHYGAGRAVRTVLDMPFVPRQPKTPVAHNALADAVAQAKAVQGVFAALKTLSEGAR